MLERALGAALPTAEAEGHVGRRSSYEVVVNASYLAWSKLARGGFPDFKALAAEIAAFASTGAVPATWSKVA